jgi:hypothetical protein
MPHERYKLDLSEISNGFLLKTWIHSSFARKHKSLIRYYKRGRLRIARISATFNGLARVVWMDASERERERERERECVHGDTFSHESHPGCSKGEIRIILVQSKCELDQKRFLVRARKKQLSESQTCAELTFQKKTRSQSYNFHSLYLGFVVG